MKFLVVSTNTKDVSPFVAAESQRVDELRAAGTITGGWLKSDLSGAILVLECADEAEATAALNTLPTAINDATTFVLTPIVDLDGITAPADSRDMYVVHNMLRRGFGELPDLVRGVAAHEERAEKVADHARLLVTTLTTHHEAEDAVLWPKLIERCPAPPAPLVESMEKQHRLLRSLLDSVAASAAKYRATRGAAERDDLARSVEEVLDPLHEHLAAEEREVLPLIDRYLTSAEWAAVGEHGLPHLTPTQTQLVFGMMLRVATEDQRAVLAGNVPHEIFAQMAQVAPSALAAYERELYGQETAVLGGVATSAGCRRA